MQIVVLTWASQESRSVDSWEKKFGRKIKDGEMVIGR
jgi:hypothetical protein